MKTARTLVAAGALVLAGGLAGCGSSSSASASGSKADFCKAFNTLSAHATPKQAADALGALKPPAGMDATAQKGLSVLVAHLRALPPNAKPGQITQMVKGFNATDSTNVRAFISYYAQECQSIPSDSSS